MNFHHHRQQALDKEPATKGDIRKLAEKLKRDYVRQVDFENEMVGYSKTDPMLREMHRIATGKVAVAQADAHKAAMWEKISGFLQSAAIPALVAWIVSTDFEWSSLFDWMG